MAKQRKRGSGGISHRKDGRWEGRYVIGYNEKGLPITKNVLAKTKSECAEKLKDLKAQYEKPKEDGISAGMTFGAWLDFWYQNCKKPALRPNTQISYELRIYGYVIPELGEFQLGKLTQGDFQKLYTHLKQNGRRKECRAIRRRAVRRNGARLSRHLPCGAGRSRQAQAARPQSDRQLQASQQHTT